MIHIFCQLSDKITLYAMFTKLILKDLCLCCALIIYHSLIGYDVKYLIFVFCSFSLFKIVG